MVTDRGIRNPEYARATRVYCMGFLKEVMPRGIEPTDLDFGWSAGAMTVDDRGQRFLSWEFKTLGSSVSVGQKRYIRNRLMRDADKHWMFIVNHFSVESHVVKYEEMVGFHVLGFIGGAWCFSICEQKRPRKAVVDLSRRLVTEWWKGEQQFREAAKVLLRWYPPNVHWERFL